MMKMEKKLTRLWAKRMHTSLKCYKENLIYLFAMEKNILAYETANKQTVATSQEPDKQQKPANADINLDSEEELVNLAENLHEAASSTNQPSTSSTMSDESMKPKSLLDERTTKQMTELKNQLFCIQEFRELFLTMLKDFDQGKMSK